MNHFIHLGRRQDKCLRNLTKLFNAVSTMNSYYKAEVNHDMPQFAG